MGESFQRFVGSAMRSWKRRSCSESETRTPAFHVDQESGHRVHEREAVGSGVEHVLGFCTPEEYRRFLQQCPIFERLLVEDGIMLLKYWFSVSDEEQERRFRSRLEDPLRRWKLSPMDLESRARWVDYSKAKDEMFVHTDISEAPWWVVEGDDKRRARLNCIAHLLSIVPYEDVVEAPLELPPRPPESDYERPPRDLFRYVPDYTATLLGE